MKLCIIERGNGFPVGGTLVGFWDESGDLRSFRIDGTSGYIQTDRAAGGSNYVWCDATEVTLDLDEEEEEEVETEMWGVALSLDDGEGEGEDVE